MTIGLHIGGQTFRSLRRRGERLIARSVPAVYVDLPDTETHRRLLQQAGIPHAPCEEALIVFGQEAVELAASLRLPLLPLLDAGRLPTQDPLARQIMACAVESLLPGPAPANELCCVAVTGAGAAPRFAHESSELVSFIDRLVTLRGYRTLPLSCGHATTLAELGGGRFCGVALHLGAEFCALSASWHGREIARAACDMGIAAVDRSFAEAREWHLWDTQGNRYLDMQRVDALRRGIRNINSPVGPDEKLLADMYRLWLREMLSALDEQLREKTSLKQTPQPLPLVCSAESRLPPGLRDLLQTELEHSPISVAVDRLRMADHSSYVVARGCLIHAESESTLAARSA